MTSIWTIAALCFKLIFKLIIYFLTTLLHGYYGH